jgi:uncharacterized protein
MKIFKHITLVFLVVSSVYGQNINGRFEGAVTREGSVQLMNFDFYNEEGIQKGTYEIPENGIFDVPINEIKIVNDTLHLKFYFGNFFCFISENKKEITGISEKWNPKLRLHVKKAQKRKKPYTKQNIVFSNKDIQLSGMIYEPLNNNGQPSKYIILVHGSGAQDRYSPYYISLGYALSKRGFGVLLYDKRGTGKSSGNFETASMENLVDDAVAAYNYLKTLVGVKNIEIGFLGTSQGGWIAPLAANKVGDCDFLILNVGPAVSVFEQDLHRVEYSMKADGWNQSDIDLALAYTKLYFQFANDKKNKTWLKLKQLSSEVKNKKWVEYVNIPENKDDFDWWRNNNYDPETTLKNLNCRTLSLFGEFDPLVPPLENAKLMMEYLTTSGIRFDIKVISGALHDMKTFQGLNGDNWDWPLVYWKWRTEPKEYMQSIIEFLDKK